MCDTTIEHHTVRCIMVTVVCLTVMANTPHAHAHTPSSSSSLSISGSPKASSRNVKPITPTDMLPILATTARPDAELADQIESIDVTAHEIILLTSKIGPSETAQVTITVVEVETWTELPPIKLTGIFLLVSRGRYTINFLVPNRWYGVVFRCEQRQPKALGGSLMPIGIGTLEDSHVNEERHLVKTHKDDGSNFDAQPLVKISTRRFSNSGKSLENLVVTINWEQHPSERSNLDAIANITLFCKQYIKYKQLRLYGREIEKSVEVKLDNHFEIMEFYNETRQIIASITPKNCPRICWNVEVVAESPRGAQFRRAGTHDCETIVVVSATTNLREYLGYDIHGSNLTIHTNYSAPERSDYEFDAYVQLVAIPLHEPHNKSTTVRYKTFSTSSDRTNDFVLSHLEPKKLYAVEYKYGKESPFAYVESRRFVVEMLAGGDASVTSEQSKNITDQLRQWPIRVIIERVTLDVNMSPIVSSDRYSGDTKTPFQFAELLDEPVRQHVIDTREKNLLTENKKREDIFENFDRPVRVEKEAVAGELAPVRPVNADPRYDSHSSAYETNQKERSYFSVKKEAKHHTPKIIFQLEPEFQDHEIGVELEPFCELSSANTTQELPVMSIGDDGDEENIDEKKLSSSSNVRSQFWLTRSQPNRELRHLDVVDAVCGKTPTHPLCRLKFFPNATNPQNMERCTNGAKLCYTLSIRVHDKIYTMGRRCVDIAEQIATQMAQDEAVNAAEAQARHAAADEPAGNRAYRHNILFFFLLPLIIAFFCFFINLRAIF